MPLLQSSQDHLPDIDAPPSPTSLASAKALIAASLSPSEITHPSLPPLEASPFTTPALTTALSALENNNPSTSLDLSRYEAPSAPTSRSAQAWTSAVRTASMNAAYLSSRSTNLALLETFGRNAWLVSNSGLEDLLRGLEREVAASRTELEEVERSRREARGGAAGAEIVELERAWREGVGRHIEVQVAVAKVKEEIRARRMGQASASS